MVAIHSRPSLRGLRLNESISCELCLQIIEGRPLVVRLRSDGTPRLGDHQRQSEDDNAKLYASFIPQHIGEGDLRTMCAQYGPVTSCRVIVDRESGRSKGYGFITMDSEASALAAICGLDGQLLPGASRPMSLKVAESRNAGSRVASASRSFPGEHHLLQLKQLEQLLLQHLRVRNPSMKTFHWNGSPCRRRLGARAVSAAAHPTCMGWWTSLLCSSS